MFVLRVWDGGLEPPFEIPATPELRIGRAAGIGHCLLKDPNAGRLAAQLVLVGGALYIEDLGSRNPTTIRGVRKLSKGERVALTQGMTIEIGRTTLVVTGTSDAVLDPEVTMSGGDSVGSKTLIGGAAARTPNNDKTDPPAPAQPPAKPPVLHTRGTQPPPPEPRAPQRQVTAPPPAPRNSPPPVPASGAQPPPEQRGPQRPVTVPQPPPRTQPPPTPIRPHAPAAEVPEAAPRPPAQRAPAAESPSSGALPVPAVRPTMERPPGMSDDDAAQLVGRGTVQIRPVNKLAQLGAMKGANARLVIVNDADRRVVKIEAADFTIGREKGECVLGHKSVSQPHAKIAFVIQTMSFQIEDLDSINQTVLGSVALNPRRPQPLQPESLLMFGTIEAVFVVTRDSNNELIPEARYATALQILQADKLVSVEQGRVATAEAAKGERTIGESLMLTGVISARAWTKAFETAANWRIPPPPPPKPKWKVWVGLLVLAAVAALIWVFRSRLGLG